ncbi:MAG: ribosomal protein L13e [Candidatus Helarchaeota archaeon]|nr:ribosomal protein L13e [Candidatus Helarchaeota archaeon]
MSDEIKGQRMGELSAPVKKHPMVQKPKKYLKARKGRGFSLKELKSASIPLDDAKKLPIVIDARRKSLHDENIKILSALYRDFVSLRSEASIELEISKKDAFKELKQLRGIKSSEAKLLIEAGVKSLKTLMDEDPAPLADDTKIRAEKIEHWIDQAKELVKRKGVTDSIDELLQVKGVNKTYAKKLVNFGILSIEDLSQENAEILSKDLKISEKILTVWIEDAMRLTGKKVPKKKEPPKKLKEEKKKPPKKPKEEKKKPPKKPKEEKKKPPKKPKEEKKKPKEEKKVPPSLKDLEGIEKGDRKALKDLGITKLEQLIEEDLEEVASITGIDKADLQRWVNDARELLGLPKKEEEPKKDEAVAPKAPISFKESMKKLIKLEGIGKKTAEKLIAIGIMDYDELLDCYIKELSEKSNISEKTLEKAIESAKKLSE